MSTAKVRMYASSTHSSEPSEAPSERWIDGRVEATIRLSRTTMKSAAPVRAITACCARLVVAGVEVIGERLFDGSRTIVQDSLIFREQSDNLGLMTTTTTATALRLEDVLAALADPLRLSIVRELASADEARPCGTFELPVGKSTASHHFRVLREAGVIEQQEEGR